MYITSNAFKCKYWFTIFRAFVVNLSMRKRNALGLLERVEKKDDSANRTKDTFEKLRVVLKLLLRNTLIHVLRNGKLILWLSLICNIIHGAIYNSEVDDFSVSVHFSVTCEKEFLGNINIVTTVEGIWLPYLLRYFSLLTNMRNYGFVRCYHWSNNTEIELSLQLSWQIY